MSKNISVLILILIFIPVSKVFSWGGVNYWSPTHQVILKEAYTLLSKDPAFKNSGFLPLSSIAANEGVSLKDNLFLDFTGIGPGPDAEGASPYAWHYYNPLTRKGKAPGAVQAYYKVMANRVNQENKAKATAWSAHFLADMSVPYHIVGMSRQEALDNLANQKRFLENKIAGPAYLYDNKGEGLTPPIGWGGQNNFWEALVNYSYNHASGNADWFDPWYSNASGVYNSHETGLSSHVGWEKRAHTIYAGNNWSIHSGNPQFHPGIFPSGDGRYNPAWENGLPDNRFKTNLAETQSQQAAHFTHAAAMYTRQKIDQIYTNPGIGIDHAIRNVATLWRSSITGLRPAIYYKKNVEFDPNGYDFKCHITNTADAPAENVKVRLIILENNQVVFNNEQSAGYIKARSSKAIKFKLKIPPNGYFTAMMSVCAKYSIPDFQFASDKIYFRTDPEKQHQQLPDHQQIDPYQLAIHKSWNGSFRITSNHTSGKFKGASTTSTLRIFFDKNNKATLTFAGKKAKIMSITPTSLAYEVTAGGNFVKTSLDKLKDGSIKGTFSGKHIASNTSIGGAYSSKK